MWRCLDFASDNPRVNCAARYSADVMRLEATWAFWEKKERARWFTHAVCDIMSHRNFSNYLSYLMKKYELYKIIIISPAPDRVRRAAACRVKHLTARASSAWDRPL